MENILGLVALACGLIVGLGAMGASIGIALMGGAWAWQFNPLAGGFWLGFGHVFAGTIWTLFHILVITLQAFIFMMLTLIYVGQAHSAH